MRLPVAAGVLIALASCAVVPTGQSKAQSAPPVVAGTITTVAPGLPIETLPFTEDQAGRARTAFAASCPALMTHVDRTALTRPDDWRPACSAAAAPGSARAFFTRYFETAQIDNGRAFATGYYEPEIAGSLTRDAAHSVPVYARPADLVDLDLGAFQSALAGKRIWGRIAGGKFVPYVDRAEIDAGALTTRVPIIAWAADPIEFFFLQVQGSGRLRLPDGQVLRIGYAGQNGRDYVGIGALMRDRGLIGPGQLSMQGIMGWLRSHPAEAPAILRENKSFVFFRPLTGAGPLGAMGAPVTPRGSVAADPAFVPLGAPVWLDLDKPEARGLWVAQDTGGAIKGANRFDTFWGAGAEARTIAGGMSARGTALLLVPRGTVARFMAARGGQGAALGTRP